VLIITVPVTGTTVMLIDVSSFHNVENQSDVLITVIVFSLKSSFKIALLSTAL
jgi:hypothetical protein